MAETNVQALRHAALMRFESGFRPATGRYFVSDSCGCAAAAAALQAGCPPEAHPLDVEKVCRDAYGVTQSELGAFIEGFDRETGYWIDSEAYAYKAGASLAEEVLSA